MTTLLNWKCEYRVNHWQFEAVFVALVLVATTLARGGQLADWTGAVAVLFTFMHGQLSFDFQESQQQQRAPTVAGYKWSSRYFLTKEIFWCVTFVILSAWPLLVGTVIFTLYPYWRTWFRNSGLLG